MFQITVTTAFAASHAIRLPDGSDEPLHGHNWDLAVTVEAETLDEIETVMDFHELQRIVGEITASMHNAHLNDVEPFADGAVNPSAERLAWWIGESTRRQLPERVRLVEVSVGEAPGCTARYRP